MAARESRETELRTHEMREIYDVDYRSPFEIPAGVKKDGYEYHWARKDIKGHDDYNIERLVSQGFSPVSADRSSSISYSDPLGRNPLSKQFICQGDLILMERPEIYGIKRRERQHEMSRSKLSSLRHVTNDIPSFNRSNSSRISSF